jgi:hypothetical protein
MDSTILSFQEMAHFEKWGYVRVSQALSDAFVEKVRVVIWREMERQYGVLESDPATWNLRWPGINKNIIDTFAGTEVTTRLAGAIDQLLGKGQWRSIRTFGGLLMTLPEQKPQAWDIVAKGWHFDHDPRSYIGKIDELMLFTFYSSIRAQGGGTLVLAGSHKGAEAFFQSEKTAQGLFVHEYLTAFGQWHPYLAQLQGHQPRAWSTQQWLETTASVHGIEMCVTEFTGEPGDAILCHPGLLHAISRNTSAFPRIMRRTNIHRATRANSKR